MGKGIGVVGGPPSDGPGSDESAASGISAASVRRQLDKIVASDLFTRSTRLTRFLRYTVDKTLEGQSHQLKEYSVARDVFDKPEEFDTRTDPIVRVEARRLRGKLLEYYTSQGKSDPILIRFGRGYVPSFALQAPSPAGPETVSAPEEPEAGSVPGGPRRLPEGSGVAVLPFIDMTKDSEYGHFCDGLAEELINALTAVEGLQVASRSSAFQFKGPAQDVRDVGRKLGVTAVLEGSVRKAGKKLRITAQLASADDGFHLWSETYDANLNDEFRVQEEIAARIIETLEANQGRPRLHSLTLRHTASPAAYRMYLNGLYQMHGTRPNGLTDAIQCFQDAIEKDPAYAQAYAALANCWLKSAWLGVSVASESVPRAKAASLKALELDDSRAGAHAALGAAYAVGDWNWKAAASAFARAVELDPSEYMVYHWYSIAFLAPLGRLDEAFGAIRKTIELGPQSLYALNHVGLLHLYRGLPREAIAQHLHVLEMQPNFVPALWDLGRAHLADSAPDEAVEPLEKANELSHGQAEVLGTLGHCYAAMGREKDAQHIVRTLDKGPKTGTTHLGLARVHIGLGQSDHAHGALSEAADERAARIIEINVDPMFASLRNDPRFEAVRHTIRLSSADEPALGAAKAALEG